MVSAGIIGTFWGTFIALADFQTGAEGSGLDHQAMVNSIPKVLAGMKSAFITSLIGLFSAFVAKITLHHLPKNDPAPLPIEEETTELLREIKDGIVGEGDKSLSSQIARLQTEYRDGAAEIKQSIAGDSDSSITSQLVKLRNENSDGFKKMDAHLGGLATSEKIETLANELRDSILEPLTQTVGSLKDIRESIGSESDSSIASRLENIRESIAGESDSSITSRLAQLNTDNRAGFDKLDNRLDGLSDAIRNELVKGMTKILEDLRDVIVNQLVEQLKKTDDLLRKQLGEMLDRIEEALIRQFGETFKQFNEATQAIKKWQEEHRAHVEQLTAAFQTAAAGITQIRTECESIPATMEIWKEMMSELNNHLQSFAKIKKEAEHFLPVIKEHLDSVAEDLRKSASNFAAMEGEIENIRADIEKTQTALKKMQDDHAKKLNETIETIVKSWGDEMVGIAARVSQEINPSGNK